MLGRPSGIILLAAAFLAAGVAGIAAFSVALVTWLRTSGTSPLAQLFALAWSYTFVVTALLTWRRSHRAPPTFLAATGLLLLLLSFIFPGGQLLLSPCSQSPFFSLCSVTGICAEQVSPPPDNELQRMPGNFEPRC
jgi:hypothetical protein